MVSLFIFVNKWGEKCQKLLMWLRCKMVWGYTFFCCIREYKVKYESANTFVTYLTLPPKQPIDNAPQIFTLSPTKLYSVENYSFLSSLFHHKLLLMTKRDEDEDKFEWFSAFPDSVSQLTQITSTGVCRFCLKEEE